MKPHPQQVIGLVMLLVCLTLPAWADATREALFGDADAAFRAANQVDANRLSPQNYAKAAKLYQSASERFEKGQSLSRIQEELKEAEALLRTSTKVATRAQGVLADVMRSRANAVNAKAEHHSPKKWEKGEAKFLEAAGKLEADKEKPARKAAEEAIDAYSEAELEAIKTNYLDDARQLISQARKDKVDKLAPLTLAQAARLLQEAEQALQDDRYDVDKPRALAREAQYEARHAIYIAERLKPVDKRKRSLEELVLEMEDSIKLIAGTLEMTAELDRSSVDAVEPLRKEIVRLQRNSYELGERDKQIEQLETKLAQLETRLGMQSERMEIQERQRKQLEQVQNLFAPDEAIVLKHGDDIILRLIGLSFKTASSRIGPDDHPLLSKVEKALRVYSGSRVVVEGHTDSFGSDEDNLRLSERRSNAVRDYLLSSMKNLSEGVIAAEGFGESQPIGNNETPSGREKNRRIDLRIKANET